MTASSSSGGNTTATTNNNTGGGLWGASSSSSSSSPFSLPPSAAAAAGLRMAEATPAQGPCICYWIGPTLYVAVTNRCNVRGGFRGWVGG